MKSPCIKICKLKDGMCLGCFRLIDEISKWKSMNNDEKQQVLDNIKQRGYNVIKDDAE
jgi:predicted Fe-S protein YdhL (DUF1289 family)